MLKVLLILLVLLSINLLFLINTSNQKKYFNFYQPLLKKSSSYFAVYLSEENRILLHFVN